MEMDSARLQVALSQELADISDLLQQELDAGKDKAQARENNYYFLLLMMEQPDLHPKDYESVLVARGKRVPGYEVQRQLRISDLYSVPRRAQFRRMMDDVCSSTLNLLTGQSPNPGQEYDAVAKTVRSRDFSRLIIHGKAYLIGLTLKPIWSERIRATSFGQVARTVEAVAQRGSYKLCEEAARRLVDALGIEYGFGKRRTSAERVQDVLEDVQATEDFDDMRATLLIVQRELRHLKDEFEEQVNTAYQDYVREFFARMNSARYSYLLDTIAQTDALLEELHRQGWTMDPRLQAIPMVIQIFMNLVRSCGVSAIETIGSHKKIARTDLTDYEFVGSADHKATELIDVVVKTPGWKMGEVVLSRPRVEEGNVSGNS